MIKLFSNIFMISIFSKVQTKRTAWVKMNIDCNSWYSIWSSVNSNELYGNLGIYDPDSAAGENIFQHLHTLRVVHESKTKLALKWQRFALTEQVPFHLRVWSIWHATLVMPQRYSPVMDNMQVCHYQNLKEAPIIGKFNWFCRLQVHWDLPYKISTTFL